MINDQIQAFQDRKDLTAGKLQYVHITVAFAWLKGNFDFGQMILTLDSLQLSQLTVIV